MIRRISLHNVGLFNNAKVPQELKHLVLIYAENASGKTTFAEVLRSLETDEPSIITKKRTFETQNNQHVVIERDEDPSTITFQNGRWEPVLPPVLPPVRVFDEIFVDDNMYSGLDVGPEHRQNLHDFALGKQGVYLSRRRDELSRDIIQYNTDMRKAAEPVTDEQRGGLSMDQFCDIPEMSNIEAEMEKAKIKFKAFQDSDIIRDTHAFEKINLPAFDERAINLILQHSLENLDETAAARVADHIDSLGDGGESWLAKGMGYMPDDAKKCPFCGQEADNVSIIEHYRAYFSEAYASLKSDIEAMLDSVRNTHSSNVQTEFERTIGANKSVGHVWSEYGLHLPDIDTRTIMADWASTLNKIVGMLEAKRAAPLDRMSLDSDMVEAYERHRGLVEGINNKIDAHNYEIRKKKEMVESDTVQSVYRKLDRLETTMKRYSDATAAWCDMYVQARANKNNANEEKAQVTKQLKEYRDQAFQPLQNGVNRYLRRFGVRFVIEGFTFKNIGSGSTSNYSVCVDNTSIGTGKPKSEDGQTVGEALSTSDRNTLALAFFLASLDADENLANTTVVIDDPISSFDDHRSLATVQTLRRLSEKVGQMIILSHKASFLDKIWRKIDHEECLPLSIVYSGTSSAICNWTIGLESNNEQAKRHRRLEAYAKDKTENPRKVLEDIRLYLEAVLETRYADNYNASIQTGSFLNECETKLGKDSQILDKATIDELRDILEYANPSKHGSGKTLEDRGINGDQLRVYAERTLNVTKMSV